MRKIILLDLNKTLAKECTWIPHRGLYFPQKDVYCTELAETLTAFYSDWEIHLVTARLKRYEDETIRKINKDIHLNIEKTCFKDNKEQRVPVHFFKRRYAEKLQNEAKQESMELYLKAIESNSQTKKEYAKIGIIDCQTRDQFLSDTQATLWD